MADDVKATPKIDTGKVEQEVSWIGARLREKSTYAGLTVVVSLALPLLAKIVPGLSDASSAAIVADISGIGIGVGGLIAIVLPEGGAKVAKTAAMVLFALATAALWHSPAAAQSPSVMPQYKFPGTPAAAKTASTRVASPVAPAAPSVKLSAQAVQQNPLALLQQFTVADLDAALADANAQTPPDTAAAACYTAIETLVKSNVANPLPAGPGVFQALQKARDAKAALANMQSPTGPLAGLNNACAPLVLDAQNTLLMLGLSVGVVANPIGAPAALAGIPAAVAGFLALPKLIP